MNTTPATASAVLLRSPKVAGRLIARAVAVGGVLVLNLLGVVSPANAADPTLGPNLLNNGGFEEPALTSTPDIGYMTGDSFPGWLYVTTSDAYVYISPEIANPFGEPGTYAPAEGNQFIGLMGGNYPGSTSGQRSYGLYQQYPTEVGKTYQVSFWLAGGPNADKNSDYYSTAGVTAGDDGGGGNIDSPNFSPTSTTWVQHTYTYIATKTLGGISVGAGQAPGAAAVPLFDGIAVQEVIPAVVDTPIASAPVVLLSITGAGVALAGVLTALGRRRRVASPAPR